ncbi:hypothetical protein FRX31_011224 [Thalictrum thalictroides]|uniref:Uncharacterized protein n=1 Tax=Thalictrum thalictroides TaxID=46969 RepID=A0A7J6WT25_THATH|nr:hypothetical protein FRX31_011224 [Thalictrum thalictroides]
MGNEMGNNNVSGLQEPEKSESEPPNNSSGVPTVAIYGKDVNIEKQSISSPNKVDFHEKLEDFSSENPYSIDEKEASEERELRNNEIQATDRCSKALMSNDTSDEETETGLLSEDGLGNENTSAYENLSGLTGHQRENLSTLREIGESKDSPLGITMSPLDPESVVSLDINGDQQKPDNFNVKPRVEDTGVLQRSGKDIQGMNGPHGSEENGKELESEAEQFPDGSAAPISNAEVEKHGDGMQEKVIESQEATLLDMSNTNENKLETEVGITLKYAPNEAEKEHYEERPLELKFDRKYSTDSLLEPLPVTKSLESFEVQTSAKDKSVVLADDTDLNEKESEAEQEKHNVKSSSFLESEEEQMVDEMKTPNSEHMTIIVEHEDEKKGIEIDGLNKDGNKTDARSNKEKVIDNGHKVDRNIWSVCEENSISLKKESEMLGEVSSSPTDFAVADTNSEGEKIPICSSTMGISFVVEAVDEKGELQDYSQKNAEQTKEPILSQLDPIKPVPINNFQDASFIECLQGQEHVCTTDSKCGTDSNMGFGSPDSNESYNTAYEQETLSPKVEAGTKSSFNFDNQIAETVVTEMQEEMNKKDGNAAFAHLEIEAKHGIGWLTTEPYSVKLNIHVVSKDGAAEESKQTPQQYEEKTISSEVLRPNCCSTEISANKVDVSIGNPCAEDNYSENRSQDQISEDKGVITLGRTNSEKSNIPLLSFFKEESSIVGSQHKQEKLVAKKGSEGKWNSHDGKTKATTILQGGVKRKPKPLLFSMCMCCTTDVP